MTSLINPTESQVPSVKKVRINTLPVNKWKTQAHSAALAS